MGPFPTVYAWPHTFHLPRPTHGVHTATHDISATYIVFSPSHIYLPPMYLPAFPYTLTDTCTAMYTLPPLPHTSPAKYASHSLVVYYKSRV